MLLGLSGRMLYKWFHCTRSPGTGLDDESAMRRLLLTVFAVSCAGIAAVIALRMRQGGSGHGRPSDGQSKTAERASRQLAASSPSSLSPRVNVRIPPRSPVRVPAAVPPGLGVAASSSPDWANLPAAVRLICGQDGNKDYAARIAAAHQFGTDLAPAEIQALYWFLHQKCASQGDLSPESFAALKNDILQALVKQVPLPPDLGREIVEMYRDRVTDLIWRDYCVQHLAIYYERRWQDPSREVAIPPPAEGSPPVARGLLVRFPGDPDRDEILNAFDEALQEKDNGIAGTALLGLYRLSSGKYVETGATALGGKALAMALDEGCAVQTRVTAVAICGLTGRSEVLPVARILAQTADSLSLRLSSIATIGALGAAQDRELLEGLRAGPDQRTYKAIDVALNKLKQKEVPVP